MLSKTAMVKSFVFLCVGWPTLAKALEAQQTSRFLDRLAPAGLEHGEVFEGGGYQGLSLRAIGACWTAVANIFPACLVTRKPAGI